MPIISCFGKILAFSENKSIRQIGPETLATSLCVRSNIVDDMLIIDWLGAFTVERIGDKIALSRNGLYLSANPDGEQVSIDRKEAREWEHFTVLPEINAHSHLAKFFTDQALQSYQFCYTGTSSERLTELAAFFPNEEYLAYHQQILARHEVRNFATPKIFFNCEMSSMFEKDWLAELMPFLSVNVINDLSGAKNESLVIVDSYIRQDKVAFYRELFYRGNTIFLIHLSDEIFFDSIDIYKYCNIVWRNLYNPIINNRKNVTFFPLGYKHGFTKDTICPPSNMRKYTWFFAGDIKKSTRADMYFYMNTVENGYTHLTTYFNSSDALNVQDYRAIMNDSLFVPCPAGFVHLDSFRIYEALEAGCIPIIENGRGADFLTPWIGSHPIPMVKDWSEAPALINAILCSGAAESLRTSCHDWWLNTKGTFARKARHDLDIFPSVMPFWSV